MQLRSNDNEHSASTKLIASTKDKDPRRQRRREILRGLVTASKSPVARPVNARAGFGRVRRRRDRRLESAATNALTPTLSSSPTMLFLSAPMLFASAPMLSSSGGWACPLTAQRPACRSSECAKQRCKNDGLKLSLPEKSPPLRIKCNVDSVAVKEVVPEEPRNSSPRKTLLIEYSKWRLLITKHVCSRS